MLSRYPYAVQSIIKDQNEDIKSEKKAKFKKLPLIVRHQTYLCKCSMYLSVTNKKDLAQVEFLVHALFNHSDPYEREKSKKLPCSKCCHFDNKSCRMTA